MQWKLLIRLQGSGLYCRPLIKKPPPFKGLNIRIPIIIAIYGRGFVNHGSRLQPRFLPCWVAVKKIKSGCHSGYICSK